MSASTYSNKIGLPTNLSLSSSERQQAESTASQSGNAAGGFRSSIFQNFALGGSTLTSSADAGGGGPKTVWIVLGLVAVGLGIYYVSRK
jgi:hypothetical protein